MTISAYVEPILDSVCAIEGVIAMVGILVMAWGKARAFVETHKWPAWVAGITLVALWSINFFYNNFGRSDALISTESQMPPPWVTPYEFQRIEGKVFENQQVKMDGRHFINCKFRNVTIVYAGAAPIAVTGAEISGKTFFQTPNPSIESAVVMLYGFGFFGNKLDIRKPPDALITPPMFRP